jgi:hypothetical protein
VLVYLVPELVYLVDYDDHHLRLEVHLLKVHLYVLVVDSLVFDHPIFDRLINL